MTTDPKALRLTQEERHRAYSEDALLSFSPYGLEQVADAQLNKVLNTEVDCPRCEGKGVERKDGMEFRCGLCGGDEVFRSGHTKVYHKGAGRVSIRALLERSQG